MPFRLCKSRLAESSNACWSCGTGFIGGACGCCAGNGRVNNIVAISAAPGSKPKVHRYPLLICSLRSPSQERDYQSNL